MKNNVLIFLLNISLFSICYGQTYDFINKTIGSVQQDTTYLMDTFITDFSIETSSFNIENIKDWWEPLPHPKTPPIQPFLNNFKLDHLRADMLKNKNDSIIDFELLDNRFIKVSNKLKEINLTKGDYKKHPGNVIFTISKPVFNCSNNWGVIIIETFNPSLNIYSGGEMLIYRKLNNEWVLYHKLQLWMS